MCGGVLVVVVVSAVCVRALLRPSISFAQPPDLLPSFAPHNHHTATPKKRHQRSDAVAKARAALDGSAAAEADLEARLRSLRQRAAALKAEAAGARSASAAVQVLMDAKRSGEIAGVCGRLGDLGAIDAAYDVAVSTACPALDYIVVETTSDAQVGGALRVFVCVCVVLCILLCV